MAEPFLSEIRLFSFELAPKGWGFCNGQLLPINQNMALFSLLESRYGGNGVTNFALPDLRGRTPIHVGSGHLLAERGGEQAHTLSAAETPAHNHPVNASTTASGGSDNPTGRFLGGASNLYHAPANLTTINPGTIANSGGGQAHQNMQPFLTLNFCIALQGIFPSQN
jgi:microcystin-dependent protein